MFSSRKCLKALALIFASAAFCLPGGASAQFLVTCPGDSLQAAINAGEDFIEFTGTCAEGIFIGRDGVTVQGTSPGTSIIAPPGSGASADGVSVVGATRVRLRNLKITGGSIVFFGNGSFVDLNNSTIENTFSGVVVTRGSDLRADGNTITHGVPQSDDACNGICILTNSSLQMTNTTINGDSSNVVVGGPLYALRDGSLLLRGGNVITNAGDQAAVGVFQDSNLRQDDPSVTSGGTSNGLDTFNGSTALEVFGEAYADIRAAVLNGNTVVDLDATLKFIGPFGSRPDETVVNGAITVRRASKVAITDPLVTINGDITCEDKTSRAEGQFQGTGKYKKCKDFNNKKSKK